MWRIKALQMVYTHTINSGNAIYEYQLLVQLHKLNNIARTADRMTYSHT